MKYILTQAELDSLYSKKEYEKMKKSALTLSIKLAETISRNEHGWKGCVAKGTSEYCDCCPAKNDCPYENKCWSN